MCGARLIDTVIANQMRKREQMGDLGWIVARHDHGKCN